MLFELAEPIGPEQVPEIICKKLGYLRFQKLAQSEIEQSLEDGNECIPLISIGETTYFLKPDALGIGEGPRKSWGVVSINGDGAEYRHVGRISTQLNPFYVTGFFVTENPDGSPRNDYRIFTFKDGSCLIAEQDYQRTFSDAEIESPSRGMTREVLHSPGDIPEAGYPQQFIDYSGEELRVLVAFTQPAIEAIKLMEFHCLSEIEALQAYTRDRFLDLELACAFGRTKPKFTPVIYKSPLPPTERKSCLKTWQRIHRASASHDDACLTGLWTKRDKACCQLVTVFMDPRHTLDHGQAQLFAQKDTGLFVSRVGTESIYVFVHEMGHVFGMQHNPAAPKPYSFGQAHKCMKYQTAMGDYHEFTLRLPVFSSDSADARKYWNNRTLGSPEEDNQIVFDLNYSRLISMKES